MTSALRTAVRARQRRSLVAEPLVRFACFGVFSVPRSDSLRFLAPFPSSHRQGCFQNHPWVGPPFLFFTVYRCRSVSFDFRAVRCRGRMRSGQERPYFLSHPERSNQQINGSLEECRMISFNAVTEEQK